eukprot:g43775.t1
MHFGKANQGRTYTLNGKVLGSVAEQRDLGVQVLSSLKVESQVDRAVKKAFSMLAFIGQCIENKSWEVMLQLYRTLVRPLLEYCVRFCSPCYRKDVVKFERVQKRFTRRLPGLEDLSYRERLSKLRLFPLECWRMRGDLIEVYKIMRRMDRVNNQSLYHRMGEYKTGGHRFKVRGKRFRMDLMGDLFTERLMHVRNEEVVEAGTIATFKRHLDGHMNRKRLGEYGPNAGKWDQINLGYLVGMDEFNRRVCFHA